MRREFWSLPRRLLGHGPKKSYAQLENRCGAHGRATGVRSEVRGKKGLCRGKAGWIEAGCGHDQRRRYLTWAALFRIPTRQGSGFVSHRVRRASGSLSQRGTTISARIRIGWTVPTLRRYGFAYQDPPRPQSAPSASPDPPDQNEVSIRMRSRSPRPLGYLRR
jgi:hypothetical protein